MISTYGNVCKIDSWWLCYVDFECQTELTEK